MTQGGRGVAGERSFAASERAGYGADDQRHRSAMPTTTRREKKRVAKYRDDPRTVPRSPRALEIIRGTPRVGEKSRCH
jgi:hypothetical protein